MDDNLVEWYEPVTPEMAEFLTDLYKKYKEVHIGTPLEEMDFNGVFLMVSFDYWYISKVEIGEIDEREDLPISKAKEEYLKNFEKIHLDKIM